IEDSREQVENLRFSPVVENSAHGVKIGLRKVVGEKVTGDQLDAIGHRRNTHDLPGQRHRGGEGKYNLLPNRISEAGGDREVPGRPSEVDKPPEPAEIEGRDDLRRADQSIAVHPHQELTEGGVGSKEVREDRTVPAKRLLPAVRSVAHRALQVG